MMNLEKETYTKEEVETILQGLTEEVETLKVAVLEKDDDLVTLKEELVNHRNDIGKSNLESNVRLELTKAGLNDDYFDLVMSDDLEGAMTKIEKVVEINKSRNIDNSYKPTEIRRGNTEYEQAEKQGNTQDMVKSKLSKLFG